jgi:hypothetical protein
VVTNSELALGQASDNTHYCLVMIDVTIIARFTAVYGAFEVSNADMDLSFAFEYF